MTDINSPQKTTISDWLERSPLAVSLVTLLFVLLVVGLRWNSGGRDWTYFIVAGERLVDSDETPVPILVTSEDGYDGVYFARLAFDPLTSVPEDFGIKFNNSGAYRQQRILYPFLVWCLSGGEPGWVPFWLLAVNVLSITAASLALSRIAINAGQSAYWGLAAGLASGMILAMSRDLAEPLCIALLSWALLSCQTRRYVACACFLVLAMFTREPSLITSASLGMVVVGQLVRGRERSWMLILVPLAPLPFFIAWQLYLKQNWGLLSAESKGFLFEPPFGGMIEAARLNWPERLGSAERAGLLMLGWLIWVGIETGAAIRSLWKSSQEISLTLWWSLVAWVNWTIFGSLLSEAIWIHYYGYMRISLEWALHALVIMLLSGRLPSRRLCAFTIFLALYTLRMVVKSL
ncbi:MAG: hypothetical protein HUJ26_23990 [Planctomycetaceae bacterium]|nr:hypothetical protein [Planctomycetaceae bacterium]